MFRVLDLAEDGTLTASEGVDNAVPPPAGVLRWIDLTYDNPERLDHLREHFEFHPLALEDCAHLDQRPKLEEFGNHLFLVTQGFSCPDGPVQELDLHELHAFLGERYLVTVHADPIQAVNKVWELCSVHPSPMKRGVDFLTYLLADALVDQEFPILDRISDELDDLQCQMLVKVERKDLMRVFELRRHLMLMRKVLLPQRETMAILSRWGGEHINERTSLYFRDVYDHLARLTESIESGRELLANVVDAYLSAVSMRTNEIMKYLTLLSAVFLPLAFIVGFFGQNFQDLPGLAGWTSSRGLTYTMLGLCVGTPTVMLVWFRRRGWL